MDYDEVFESSKPEMDQNQTGSVADVDPEVSPAVSEPVATGADATEDMSTPTMIQTHTSNIIQSSKSSFVTWADLRRLKFQKFRRRRSPFPKQLEGRPSFSRQWQAALAACYNSNLTTLSSNKSSLSQPLIL